MKLLQYTELDTSGLEPAFERVAALLQAGDFAGAEVKKLTGRPFYRAKLSAADRLLFQFGTYKGETYLILLEVIRNHAYEHARFLRGARFDENRLAPLTRPEPAEPADVTPLRFVNPKRRQVHVLDKVLSFDDAQEEALLRRPPLILIGSAGSGKTVLTIAKLRQLRGEILYVTRSPHLVDSSRRLYYAQGYENDQQDVTFLSFLDFVHSIRMPDGRPLPFEAFSAWFSRLRSASPVKDAHALYEEFAGVLSGSVADRPYLPLEDYLGLGIRRSIFPPEDRPAVHGLWMKYLAMLRHEGFHDLNLVCYDHHALCRPTYDFVVADEVQDLTTVQISLILKSLKQPDQFVLCGDSNQIVHPNFFSWAAVKTYFYSRQSEGPREITRILSSNYRNSPEVTALANRLLQLKNARFGSIDRESHYLVRSVADLHGTAELLVDSDAVRRDIDAKTGRSTRVALLVPRTEDKADAARIFRTPLVFSIQEAKGLEYETVVLLNFVSGNARSFSAVAEGVRGSDLEGEFTYSRAQDKSDRSLEAYKFFVNALYVGVTRAVRNVYLLERSTGHPLLGLLRLREIAPAKMRIEGRESTADEWKAEARKLEAHGKAQQAEAIRSTILRTEPVPWAVISPATLAALKAEALAAQPVRPRARKLLLDYAVTFTDPTLLKDLQRIGFAPARTPEAAYRDAQQRYAVAYHQRGYRDLLRAVERHGVDHRDPLNRTPLMMAVKLGLAPLVERLVDEGASIVAQDNWGRIPLQIALRTAFENPFYAKSSLGAVYDAVAPATLDVQLGGRLIRVDRHRMEFFVLHVMIAQFEFMVRDKIRNAIPAYETADFIGPLEHFPESVIPERRRKRQALSATLASQEVFRAATGAGINRRLFVRIKRGYYLPNPCLSIRLGGEWVAMTKVLAVDRLREERGNRLLQPLLRCIERAEKDIRAEFCNGQDSPAPRPAAGGRRRGNDKPAVPGEAAPATTTQATRPPAPAMPAPAPAMPGATDAQPAIPAEAAAATPPTPPAAPPRAAPAATAAAPELPLQWTDATATAAQPRARDDDQAAATANQPDAGPADEWVDDEDFSWGISREEAYASAKPYRKPEQPAGRNDPCPCGSGRKYKRCCGT